MMLLDFLKNIKSLIGDTIFEKLKNPYFMKSKKKNFFLCYIYMEDNQGKFQDGKKIKILYIATWDIISI